MTVWKIICIICTPATGPLFLIKIVRIIIQIFMVTDRSSSNKLRERLRKDNVIKCYSKTG